MDHGISGFVVDGEVDAIEAIRRLGELDRRMVRAQFDKRFTARRMAEEYVQHYLTLVRTHARLMPHSDERRDQVRIDSYDEPPAVA